MLFFLFWQERDVLHIKTIISNKQGNSFLLLHWSNTQHGLWNQTEVLREGPATYYHGTVHHGQLITPTNTHTYILSQ